MTDDADDDANDYVDEYPIFWVGPCTCDHDKDQHDWSGCTVEGCPCEAHFEE